MHHGRIQPLLPVEEMIGIIESGDRTSRRKARLCHRGTAEEPFPSGSASCADAGLRASSSPAFPDNTGRDGAEEHLYVGDPDKVPYFDLLYLYQWAQGVDQSVIDFLDERAQVVGVVADDAGLPFPPEDDPGDKRFGG